jgi:hypothetical protein
MVLLFAIFAIATTASAVQDASLETSAEAALSIGDSHLQDTTYASAEPFYRQAYTLLATKLSAGHFMAKAMLRRWNKIRELNGNKNAATDEDAPGVSTGVNTALNKSTVPLIWHCTNETIAKYSATHHLSGTTCVKHTVCDGASTDEVAGNATTDTTCPCAAGYHSETTVDNIQTCEECAAGYTCAGGAAAASLPTPQCAEDGKYTTAMGRAAMMLSSDITIPSSCTSLDAKFYDNSERNPPSPPCTLTSVTFEAATVTHITSEAFSDCANLKQIDLPSSLLEIGYAAFLRSGLTSVYVPDSVTTLGDMTSNCHKLYGCKHASSVFAYCSSMVTASIPSGMTAGSEKNLFQHTGVGCDYHCGPSCSGCTPVVVTTRP